MNQTNNIYQFLNKSNIIENRKNLVQVLNLFPIIFGTIGNLLTLSILTRKSVRKHSYLRYLSSLCVIDILCLYTWNFSLVYSYFTNKKIEHEGEIYCRFFSFFSYFILQSSSWVICSIGMDRIVSLVYRNNTNLSTVIIKKTFTVVTLVLVAFLLFNFSVLINNAEKVNLQSSKLHTYNCYEPKSFYFIWDIVHILMYSLIPFFILIIENIILYLLNVKHERRINLHCKSMSYETNRLVPYLSENGFRTSWKDMLMMKFHKKERVYKKSVNIQKINLESNKFLSKIFNKSSKFNQNGAIEINKLKAKGFDVANLLLFLNISFLFTTVPYSTFYALKLNLTINQEYKEIIINILALLQYARHSANFLIYLITSSIIKKEIKKTCTYYFK